MPSLLITPGVLARSLLLFWAIWLSVVSASNAADALQAAGVLSPGWRFASGNFAIVAESLSIYSVPQIWAAVLFLELAASALFWRAALDANPLSPHAEAKILYPFIVGIGLFCAFSSSTKCSWSTGTSRVSRRHTSPSSRHCLFRSCSSACSMSASHRADENYEARRRR